MRIIFEFDEAAGSPRILTEQPMAGTEDVAVAEIDGGAAPEYLAYMRSDEIETGPGEELVTGAGAELTVDVLEAGPAPEAAVEAAPEVLPEKKPPEVH